MNLVLLQAEDFISADRVRLQGRRFEHIQQVHRASVGDSLTVGLLHRLIGTGTVEQLANDALVLRVQLHQTPPPALPLSLIIALPRPQMLKRILQTCATMGVKKLYLINSQRVEKSYWQTPLLSSEKIREHCILGLEQAKDTQLPEIILEKRFTPFVEDRLPALCQNTRAVFAHPGASLPCPQASERQTTLLIGPEGGFIADEITQFEAAGCQGFHLGKRILRVETAVPVLLAKLFN